MVRRRLDVELVRRGLAPTRQQAQRLISAGLVTVGGSPAPKPARQVAPDEALVLLDEPERFVSRGGEKLNAALDHFGVDVAELRALDAGASTGGFTDCLLQRGAASVIAVDVGRGQLHERLRADHRVDVRERTDIRDLELPVRVDTATADLAFISVRSYLDALVANVEAHGDLVVLIKPQFEAGRAEASRGRGVISDPLIWRSVLTDVHAWVTDRGVGIMEYMVSPLRGAQGNVEFFAHLRPAAPAAVDPVGSAAIDLIIEQARALT